MNFGGRALPGSFLLFKTVEIKKMPTYKDNTAYIDIPGGVDLAATFESGQAFRWRKAAPGVYDGMTGSRCARICRTETGISITPCGEDDYEFWRHYLDMDTDYAACERILAEDPVLTESVSAYDGMRILQQPIWECLVSFIISSNNNVKRISMIVERLCACFGEDMGGWQAFPTAQRLYEAGEEAIFSCGAGYRAAYIFRAAQAVVNGFDPDKLPGLQYEEAKKELVKLHGVGEKVADCVLLYSCGFREAFPVDVWVARAVLKRFPDAGETREEIGSFARARYGKLAGLAQQYFFHFERMNR
jgi:N-glycosylase/DNA lyase